MLKKLFKKLENMRYDNYWIYYPGVGKIYSKDVATGAKLLLHWWDRFDIRKVAEAVLMSQTILTGVAKPEEFGDGDNWKF